MTQKMLIKPVPKTHKLIKPIRPNLHKAKTYAVRSAKQTTSSMEVVCTALERIDPQFDKLITQKRRKHNAINRP